VSKSSPYNKFQTKPAAGDVITVVPEMFDTAEIDAPVPPAAPEQPPLPVTPFPPEFALGNNPAGPLPPEMLRVGPGRSVSTAEAEAVVAASAAASATLVTGAPLPTNAIRDDADPLLVRCLGVLERLTAGGLILGYDGRREAIDVAQAVRQRVGGG
jgi:hypothetical protein